jgi:2-methyl-3-hydroxypyridine 5-carboxylic acid dioxygenase
MVRDSLDLTQEHTQFPIGVIRLLVPRSEEEADSEEWNNYINFWQISPFRRVLYAPCNKNDLYLMLGADFDDTEALQIPLNKRVWIDTFPHLEGILSRIGEDLRCDQYELLKLETWSAGRVAIIGDAAHAMPPTIAQGVGSGMMNALALAVALDEFADVPTALSRWEEKERPMTEHSQEISRQRVFNLAPSENNDRNKWEEGVLRTAHHLPTGAQP